MWLTKAVDISVGYPVHVVVYTVPACPAGYPLYIAQCGTNVKPGFIWCRQLSLTIRLGLSSTQQMRKSIQIQFEIIITPSFFLRNASSMHPAGLLGPEETACTTRVSKSYVYGEITDHALNYRVNYRYGLHCIVWSMQVY